MAFASSKSYIGLSISVSRRTLDHRYLNHVKELQSVSQHQKHCSSALSRSHLANRETGSSGQSGETPAENEYDSQCALDPSNDENPLYWGAVSFRLLPSQKSLITFSRE